MGLKDYVGKYWAGAEIMYAVIIAITFTSSLRGIRFATPEIVESVAMTALACCVAWGVADGFFYTWERSYNLRGERRIVGLARSDEGRPDAVKEVRDQLDDTILRHLSDEDRGRLYQSAVDGLSKVQAKEEAARKGYLYIILWTTIIATLSGLLVVFPLFLIDDLDVSLPLSNLIGISLLFLVGYVRSNSPTRVGRLGTAIVSALVGIIITVITVVLGG